MKPDVPKRCSLCLFLYSVRTHENCTVCRDQQMKESFLCNMVRQTSRGDRFKCDAFRPRLTLVGARKQQAGDSIPVCRDKKEYFAEVIRSIGSGGCPNGGACRNGACGSSAKEKDIVRKYHVVWSVRHRKSVFSTGSRYISFLHDIFVSCGRLMKGKALLVWLAPDHLHFYLECMDSEPIDETIEDMQGLVQDALMQEYLELAKDFDNGTMWEREFFVEEIV